LRAVRPCPAPPLRIDAWLPDKSFEKRGLAQRERLPASRRHPAAREAVRTLAPGCQPLPHLVSKPW
jgi:hypothetical protein